MLVSFILFLIIFSVVVIGHEFGHYMIARRNGIRVNEFTVGVGPVLCSKMVGETNFCFRLLPLGGACIFDGADALEDAEKEPDEHAYPNAKVGARIATALAGPAMNFIIGFLFAVIIVAFCGTDRPVAQQIMEGSAAQEAGLEAGDVITGINGQSIHLFREVQLASLVNYGEELDITYKRDGVKYKTHLTPRFDETDNRYYIGIISSGAYEPVKGLQIFQYGFYEAKYWVRATFQSLGLIFRGHFQIDDLSGPVGVAKVVDDTYQETKQYGVSSVVLSMLNIATLLSINLGIMNLLPIPGLDGGKLVIYVIEAIRGKKISPEHEGAVTLVGVAFLVALMAIVMFNDIMKFFR